MTIAIRQAEESIAAVPDPAIESAFDICRYVTEIAAGTPRPQEES